MNRDSFLMLLLGMILMAVCSSAYFLSRQMQLIQYTNIKMQLERDDAVLTALMPLTCPVVEEKKGGKGK